MKKNNTINIKFKNKVIFIRNINRTINFILKN